MEAKLKLFVTALFSTLFRLTVMQTSDASKLFRADADIEKSEVSETFAAFEPLPISFSRCRPGRPNWRETRHWENPLSLKSRSIVCEYGMATPGPQKAEGFCDGHLCRYVPASCTSEWAFLVNAGAFPDRENASAVQRPFRTGHLPRAFPDSTSHVPDFRLMG